MAQPVTGMAQRHRAACGQSHAAFGGRCIPAETCRFAALIVALRSKYTRASSPGGGSSLARLVSRAPRPPRHSRHFIHRLLGVPTAFRRPRLGPVNRRAWRWEFRGLRPRCRSEGPHRKDWPALLATSFEARPRREAPGAPGVFPSSSRGRRSRRGWPSRSLPSGTGRGACPRRGFGPAGRDPPR